MAFFTTYTGVLLQSLPSEAEDLVDKLPTDQEAAAFPEVVRTKTFVLEPMSLEDALEQVLPLSALIFVAAECMCVA